ncbi:MAG: glycosyltransferase [Bacteroidaceae bacterium]|nr:glycosyltransferase [Bacteroidaceae bacterium]
MKLSIIVPVYKIRRYLQRCIESILQQTYTDYELILVDDGSPDGCGSVCDRFALECDKVKVIHKKNGGLSSARNAGIAAAKGEYITFVDGDDTIASGTYYYNMRILMSNPDIDILEYPVTKNYESPQSEVLSFKPEKVSGNDIFPDWIKRKGYEHSFSWNKIYRAELFNFVRFPEGEVFEDTFITPTLYESAYNVYYSDCGFYYYYKNEGSITSSHSFKSQFFLYRNSVSLYEKVNDTYKMHDEAKEILLNSLDRLTDLHRCSDGEKSEYLKARKMLKGRKIAPKELFNMNIPTKRKIKFIIFSLFGIKAHCCLFAALNKKLC